MLGLSVLCPTILIVLLGSLSWCVSLLVTSHGTVPCVSVSCPTALRLEVPVVSPATLCILMSLCCVPWHCVLHLCVASHGTVPPVAVLCPTPLLRPAALRGLRRCVMPRSTVPQRCAPCVSGLCPAGTTSGAFFLFFYFLTLALSGRTL